METAIKKLVSHKIFIGADLGGKSVAAAKEQISNGYTTDVRDILTELIVDAMGKADDIEEGISHLSYYMDQIRRAKLQLEALESQMENTINQSAALRWWGDLSPNDKKSEGLNFFGFAIDDDRLDAETITAIFTNKFGG